MNNSRWLSREAFLIVVLSAFTIFLETARHFAGPFSFSGVWEDSLMLTRYAHNFLASGKMQWNPGGPPVYGLTSPFYFLVMVLPVAKFVAQNPLAIPMIASLISGALFFGMLAFTLLRLLPGPMLHRQIALAVVFLALARSTPDLTIHLISGMDTCFALLYLMIFIALQRWYAVSRSAPAAVVAAIWGGLAFGARPDLLVFTLLVPAACIVLGKSRRERFTAAGMLALTAGVLAAEILAASLYFHSPLPLPFYAKSLNLYPGLSDYKYTGFTHALEFISTYWLLYVLIAFDVATGPRDWWRDTTPLEKALALGVLIHMAYFMVGVTQIMPGGHRFYYPEVPALGYLAALATVRSLRRVPERWLETIAGWRGATRYAAIAATFLIIPVTPPNEWMVFGAMLHGRFASFDLNRELKANLPDFWFGLPRFSQLPSDLTMATTEIGHVGAMNLDKQVIDIAGLNDPLFAHHRFSAEAFFSHYHPDLIYMPHPGYRGMNQALQESPIFRRDYEVFPSARLGPAWFMGIALDRTSKYYKEMRAVVDQTCADEPPGACNLDGL